MRTSITPGDEPLPLSVPQLDDDAPPVAPTLPPAAIARFDALLHEINPDAPRVDGARVRALCAWLASLPATQAHEVLGQRLRRIQALRSILDDPDWDGDQALLARLRKLIAYIDLDADLIPDHEPLLGQLDDVLLIELAWPAFADEAEDYLDFCEYRTAEHPGGDGASRRQAWVRDRLAQIALWQHHLRVNDSHYASSGSPRELFHVG